MAYIRKDLQPGIYRDSTRYAAEGLWYDCDHIRFREGRPEKLGGWQMVNGINITGVSRAIHGWNSLDGDSWVAWGTQSKLELLNGSSKYDITPVRSSSTVANPFNTTLNSSSVIVSITSHGAITSASVIFTTIASTIGGNVLIGGEYVITSVIGTDSFQITVPTSAAATSASTGGASVAYQSLINPGPNQIHPAMDGALALGEPLRGELREQQVLSSWRCATGLLLTLVKIFWQIQRAELSISGSRPAAQPPEP